jgi:hypothetical protein
MNVAMNAKTTITITVTMSVSGRLAGMEYTMLLPCAGHSPAGKRPKWLLTTPEGELMVRRAAAALPPERVTRAVVAMCAEDDVRYSAAEAIRRAFAATPGLSVDIVILDHPTQGPAQTVQLMMDRAGVRGPIAIKDGDSLFDPLPAPRESFVAVCDLRRNPGVAGISGKSFIRLNEHGFVADIVEKEVCSSLISAGLYGFSDTAVFRQAYHALHNVQATPGLFVSHVIEQAICAGEMVAALPVEAFLDLDSEALWRDHCRRRGTLVIDIDGVVVKNQSRFFPPYWETPEQPIGANVACLRDLQAAGKQLVFMTARPETYRTKTHAMLTGLGLHAHALIMDCHHGQRCLVNDFAPSNPYPSAVAVNLERNAPSLAQLVA